MDWIDGLVELWRLAGCLAGWLAGWLDCSFTTCLSKSWLWEAFERCL
jgi:hypothetical protein